MNSNLLLFSISVNVALYKFYLGMSAFHFDKCNIFDQKTCVVVCALPHGHKPVSCMLNLCAEAASRV